jgi:general secretion pathway protein J
MSARGPSDGGFTLVEALVSLFVFSLISAGCVGMLVQSLRAQERLNGAQMVLRDIQMTQALIAADVSQIAPRRVRLADNQFAPRFVGGLESSAMAFVRAGASPETEQGAFTQLTFVEYVVRDGALVRRTRSAIDPLPGAAMSERILLRDLTSAKMTFYDGQAWSDTWLAAQGRGMPKAVALEATSKAYGALRIAAFVGVN